MPDETTVVEEEDIEEKPKANRRKYRDDDWTDEEVAARKAAITVEEPPENWVKLARVSEACKADGIAVSKLVRATGGDRGMGEPAAPVFKIVYVGRTRYMHPDVMTKGLAMLKDDEFLPAKRRGRKKVEGEEGEGETKAKAPAKAKPKATTRKKVSVRPAPEN